MLLPLLGFITGCLIFGSIGTIFLIYNPHFKFTISNLFIFIIGALPACLFTGFIYGSFFASKDGNLTSFISVIGLFISLSVGGLLGGFLILLFKKLLINILNQKNSID